MTENQEEKMILEIVSRIKEAAKRQKLSMSDLATEVEMTKTGFYRTLDSGSMKLITLIKIANALKVEPVVLLGAEAARLNSDCEEIKKELKHASEMVEAQKTIIELLNREK